MKGVLLRLQNRMIDVEVEIEEETETLVAEDQKEDQREDPLGLECHPKMSASTAERRAIGKYFHIIIKLIKVCYERWIGVTRWQFGREDHDMKIGTNLRDARSKCTNEVGEIDGGRTQGVTDHGIYYIG